MKRRNSGFSIVEMVVALAVSAMIAVIIAQVVAQSNRSFSKARSGLDTVDFISNLTTLLSNSDRCAIAIGLGYDPDAAVGTPDPGVQFDPTSAAGQKFSVRDPAKPTQILYTADGSANPPATAKIGSTAVIRSLKFFKTTTAPNGGDIGAVVQDTYRTGRVVIRRSVQAEMEVSIQEKDNTGYNGKTTVRRMKMVLQVEQPQTGGNWKIVKCSVPQTSANSIGWSPATNDCISVSSRDVGDAAPCPEGMYAVSQSYRMVETGPVYTYSCGCGKSGCQTCSNTATGVVVSMVCCPSVK